jgi:putative MATE family efflux protein
MNRYKQLWRAIIESISGTEQDFTSGSLKRAILLLSIPMVLEMLMESIFAVVDILFVSRLGADAVAVVGITESMMTIIYALSMGLGVGATAMVSRRIGEKNYQGASFVAIQAILAGAFISVAISIIGFMFSRDLLHMIGASEAAIASGWKYTTWMISGNMVIVLLFINNAIFRSAGDAAISMRVLWIANLLNMALDPCFIYGLGPFPELGVQGAAVATNIGRAVAVCFQFYFLLNGRHRIKLNIRAFFPDFKLMLKLLKLSLGGIAQNIIATTSWVVLIKILATFGSSVVAGYTIAIRIVVFALLPSWGVSNATATLVGQSLGANLPERAERAVWITGKINMVLMGAIGIILIIFSDFFMRLFIPDMSVVEYGSVALFIISCGFVFYSFGMVTVQAINGAGDTFTPMWLNIVCFWLIELPLAYFLTFKTGLHQKGVYLSIVIAESVLAVLGTILFLRGKWKLKKV